MSYTLIFPHMSTKSGVVAFINYSKHLESWNRKNMIEANLSYAVRPCLKIKQWSQNPSLPNKINKPMTQTQYFYIMSNFQIHYHKNVLFLCVQKLSWSNQLVGVSHNNFTVQYNIRSYSPHPTVIYQLLSIFSEIWRILSNSYIQLQLQLNRKRSGKINGHNTNLLLKTRERNIPSGKIHNIFHVLSDRLFHSLKKLSSSGSFILPNLGNGMLILLLRVLPYV